MVEGLWPALGGEVHRCCSRGCTVDVLSTNCTLHSSIPVNQRIECLLKSPSVPTIAKSNVETFLHVRVD